MQFSTKTAMEGRVLESLPLRVMGDLMNWWTKVVDHSKRRCFHDLSFWTKKPLF